ncbi:hypothetical protein ACHAXN_012607 [Cyclotella atomus]
MKLSFFSPTNHSSLSSLATTPETMAIVTLPEKSPRIRNKDSTARNLLCMFEQERTAEQDQNNSKIVPTKARRSMKHTIAGVSNKNACSFPKSKAEKAKARKSSLPTKSVLESLTAACSRHERATKSVLESLYEDQDSFSEMSRFSGGRTTMV